MMNKKVFNLSQNLLEIVGLPPLLCYYPELPKFCSGCEPGMIFECLRCKRLMPWCRGASDALEDWCDECANDYIKLEGYPTEES